MEILTGRQMQAVDRRAIDLHDIPSLTLMESAGRAVALALMADYPAAAELGVLILCGKGNNGGDGLVAARHLALHGVVPRVVLVVANGANGADGGDDALSPDAAHNLCAARDSGLPVDHVGDEAAWADIAQRTAACGIVLDALLGTGIRGGARGLAACAIRSLNERDPESRQVVSIDLPSGVDADVGRLAGSAVRADRTYTLCRPKRALVLPPASDLAGALRVLDIGIPDAAVEAERVDLEWVDGAVARPLLPRRRPGDHKGRLGHLLAIAGSTGKSGAAVLLSRAALRSGAGLVTAAVPAAVRAEVAMQQAEIMTEPLDDTPAGGLARTALDRIAALAAGCDALALGPGLGTRPDTIEWVRKCVADRTTATVLDADGINAFAGASDLLLAAAERSGRPALILTPHPGEAARLLGSTAAAVQSDRLGAVRELVARSGAYVVLKGRHTLMSAPDGRTAVNSTGNPGMATAGSGDVLTGVLGALLARGLSAWDALRLGVFVHGAAGDLAAEQRGLDGLIASDLIENLPRALAALNPR